MWQILLRRLVRLNQMKHFRYLKEWAKDEDREVRPFAELLQLTLEEGRVLELVENYGIEVLFVAFDEIICLWREENAQET